MFGSPEPSPGASDPQEKVKELGTNLKYGLHSRDLRNLLDGPKEEVRVPNWGVGRRLWDAALCGEWTDCKLANDDGCSLQCHTAVMCSLSPVLLAHLDEGVSIPPHCAPWLEVERSGGAARIRMLGVSREVLTAVMQSAYGMPMSCPQKHLAQLQQVAHALGADALEYEARSSLRVEIAAMSTIGGFAHAAAEGDIVAARAHLLAMCKEGTATLASWDVLDLEPELFAALISRDELTLEHFPRSSPEMQVFEAALRWARHRIGLAPVDERRVVRRMRGSLPNAVSSRLVAASRRAVKQADPEAAAQSGAAPPRSLAAAAASAAGAPEPPAPPAESVDGPSSHESVEDVLKPVAHGHLVKPPEDHSLAIGRKLVRPEPKVSMLAKILTSSLGLMPPPPKGKACGNSSAPLPADYGKLLRAQLLPAILPLIRLQALSSAELAVEVLPLGILSRAEVRSLLANAVSKGAEASRGEVVPVIFSSKQRSGVQQPPLGKSSFGNAVVLVQASLRRVGMPGPGFEEVVGSVLSQLDQETRVRVASMMWTPYEWTKGILSSHSVPEEYRFVATNLIGMALFLPSAEARATALNGMARALGSDFAALAAGCEITSEHCKPALRLAEPLGRAEELSRALALAATF